MKQVKNVYDLLEDVFEFFRREYGNNEPYEVQQVGYSVKTKVVQLTIPNYSGDATPAIGLTKKDNELLFTLWGFGPGKRYAKEFFSKIAGGEAFEIHASTATDTAEYPVWVKSVNDFYPMMVFSKKGILGKLGFEILLKATELFQSDKYH